jgi:hypothetical protein
MSDVTELFLMRRESQVNKVVKESAKYFRGTTHQRRVMTVAQRLTSKVPGPMSKVARLQNFSLRIHCPLSL